MKSFFATLLLASSALAMPSSFLIQSPGESAPSSSSGSLDLQDQVDTAVERTTVTFDRSVASIVAEFKDDLEGAAAEIIKFLQHSSTDREQSARGDDHDDAHRRGAAAQHRDSTAATGIEEADEVESRRTILPPHHPPSFIDFSNYTINEILNSTLHREHPKDERLWPSHGAPHHDHSDPAFLPLHRLAWLVNRSSEAQTSLDKKGITLLAPDDRALTPPHRRRDARTHKMMRDSSEEEIVDPELLEQFGSEFFQEHEHQPVPHPFYHVQRSLLRSEVSAEWKNKEGDDKDKNDDEERRKRFARIIAYILNYHTLPSEHTGWEMASKSTIETSLNTSRVKVEPTFALFPHPYPTIKFNGYAYKRFTVKAKNGLIHLIGAPLLPPLSPLNGLFLFPQAFATLTSGLQKVDLAESLLPHWHSSEDVEDVTDEPESTMLMDQLVDEIVKENNLTSFTVFAPTNFAFARLGPKIVALLHSPFPLSKRILKYVLSYHITPDVTFYSDFVKGAKPSKDLDRFVVSDDVDVDVPLEWVLDLDAPEAAHQGGVWRVDDSEASRFMATRDLPKIPMPKIPKMPPGKMPPGRGPPPPPGRDHPHRHPRHRANVTRYELPTLLTEENKNATLKVLSIAYRRFGKGPIRRSIVVLPNHPPHRHPDSDDKAELLAEDGERVDFDCPHHRRGPPRAHPVRPARPVRVVRSDIPARNGAIQVVPSLLRPPMPHHDSPSFGQPSTNRELKFRRGLAQLFD